MPRKPSKPAAEARTRRAVIDLLKRDGPQDAAQMARQLGISAMAVRQHLYALQEETLVDYSEEPRPLGRPAKLWRLRPSADRFFTDGHGELTVGLMAAMRKTFGVDGLNKLLQVRAKAQIQEYRRAIRPDASLKKRLAVLAELRTKEGYMAEVTSQSDGSFLLVEKHCPICTAATACTELCDAELDVFRAVLGRGVKISRTEHIVSGARRCVYRVAAK